MGIDDIRSAYKKFVKKDDTFLSKLKTKFKNLIQYIYLYYLKQKK